MTSAVVLRASALGWAAQGRFILLDLDLEMRAGQWTAISGANGAGKTTLLQILSGRRAPTRGHVTLHGATLSSLAVHELGGRIAMLEHQPGLYLDLSGRENLTLLNALCGGQIDAAEELLAQVGLPPTSWEQRVRLYSRGMRQRAAMARVVGSSADVWLLDEPATGLDQPGRELLTTLIRQATAKGISVLMVTHDIEMMHKADRRLCLEQGQLQPVQERV